MGYAGQCYIMLHADQVTPELQKASEAAGRCDVEWYFGNRDCTDWLTLRGEAARQAQIHLGGNPKPFVHHNHNAYPGGLMPGWRPIEGDLMEAFNHWEYYKTYNTTDDASHLIDGAQELKELVEHLKQEGTLLHVQDNDIESVFWLAEALIGIGQRLSRLDTTYPYPDPIPEHWGPPPEGEA